MQRRINLNLFDFDGCLNRAFNRSQDHLENPHKWILGENNAFLESLKQRIQAEKYYRIIVAQGSTRQSNHLDNFAHSVNKNGSSTATPPILQSWFASQLDCDVVLDPFLLADIYGKNKAAGESYKAIIKEHRTRSWSVDHARVVSDDEKVTLIYAHVHRVAALNRDAEIVIDFYDDRTDILDHLYKTMSANNKLLPANVTLRLHRYIGQQPAGHYEEDIRPPVKGKVRLAFRDRHMWQLIPEKQLTHEANYTTAEDLHKEGLIPAHFVVAPKRAPAPTPTLAPVPAQKPVALNSEKAKKDYYAMLGELITKRDKLYLKWRDANKFGEDEDAQNYEKAYKAAQRIYDNLKSSADSFFMGDIDIIVFNKQSQKAISDDRQVLEEHRDCNYIFADLALFFVRIFQGCWRYVETGQFRFFSKTDSAQKVDAIEEQIKVITAQCASGGNNN